MYFKKLTVLVNTVEPLVATTSPQRAVFQNTKSFWLEQETEISLREERDVFSTLTFT